MFIYGVSIYPPQWNENKSDDWSVSFHPIDSFVCQSGAISQRMQIMLAVKKKVWALKPVFLNMKQLKFEVL